MDAPKEIGAGKESDNEVYEEEANNTIFNFKAFQINDSIKNEGNFAANYEDHNLKQTGANTWNVQPQANMNPRRKIVDSTKRLGERFVNERETEYSLKGNWSLYCNPNTDSIGHSEAVEILKSAQELHCTRPDLFPYPPYSCEKQNGTVVVCCYTPDYTDKDFNLKAARVIREEIHYPYVMYYHKRVDERVKTSDEDELPSQVTDREYIHMKDQDMKEEDYMKEGGKWMIFTHGDMDKHDEFWIALKPLYRNGISSLKASTAYETGKGGVINCYTADADNWSQVRKAAEAIRDTVDYRFIMYYKTNEASVQGLYREKGAKVISRYMFTLKRGFYEKDQYNRWEKIY